MSACPTPIAFEALVAYWSGDLDAAESDGVESHVFSCPVCTAMSERVAAITEKLRSLEPAVISKERVSELRAAGRLIEDNFVKPGERKTVVFAAQEIILHHLGGLDLAGVDRVGLLVRAESTGAIVTEYPAAPFDAEAGEVLIACQRHFAVFPPDIEFEVTTFVGSEPKHVTRYVVDHQFARSSGM